MTARIYNRLTATIACGLLFAASSELPADGPAAPAISNGIETGELPGARDRATSPHLFLGELRLGSRFERPAEGAAQVQPTKVDLVTTLYNPASESPFRLASLPQKAEAHGTQLRPAEVRPAATPDLTPAKENLAILPKRESSMEPPLKATEVQPAARLDPARQEARLPELPTRRSGPEVALQATEVMRAERPEFAQGGIFLTSLQPRYGEPAAPLQSAEVLPIPSPNSPAAPHVPTLDMDRPIGALTTSIAPTSGKLPNDLAMERFQGEYPGWLPRPWNEVTYFWDAPDLCYGPLRYEEANLERFGYTHCPIVQPAMSAAHFFCATLALPYTMTMRPARECIYPLGHYRPGSPVPYRPIWPEWRPLSAATEVGTIAGLILLIP